MLILVGVPQGSVLGLLYFCILNTLSDVCPSAFNCQIHDLRCDAITYDYVEQDAERLSASTVNISNKFMFYTHSLIMNLTTMINIRHLRTSKTPMLLEQLPLSAGCWIHSQLLSHECCGMVLSEVA